MDFLVNSLPNSPLVPFTVLLLVALTIPPIFERLRLPGLVGLLFAGILLGPHGVGLLSTKTETMKLLSDIGKVYLMFVAGLEIDLKVFRQTRSRSLAFGLTTFLIPLITGTTIGFVFGFGWNAAILIGSLLASHTLLGYPIVQRLGVSKNSAVAVTIGATIFTDIAALLVLAICVSIHQGEFSTGGLILQLMAIALYSLAVLVGFDRAGKEYFRRTGDEQGNQFLFVLLAVFLASVGAQMLNIDMIVGAFLAGLAVNDVVGNGPVKEKVEFVGGVLFIPFFFVDIGLLLDVPVFVEILSTQLSLTVAIVLGLIGSKFVAALIVKFIFRYDWMETLSMWSLSLPQVAATLAAALVGVQVGLLTNQVFNAVIVLMLVTSILGPILTERFARHLAPPLTSFTPPPTCGSGIWWELQPGLACDLDDPHQETSEPSDFPFTVVVPISNPLSTPYLIELAALLVRGEQGKIIPLSIAKAHVHMDAPELQSALLQSRRQLRRSLDVSRQFQANAEGKIRIDDDIAHGISRTAREKNASLIIMGWAETDSLRARLFGNVIDSVFWASHCPVAVTRLLDDPMNIRRILVPVKNITPQTIRTVQFALLLADTNQAVVTALHVGDRHTPSEAIAEFEAELTRILAQFETKAQADIKIATGDDPAQAILRAAQGEDLVILRSVRRRTAGGLTVSDVTTRVINHLTCSVVLFGEPHS
jgi:Kef-type K+ transport system membrane component KefB